ncbi:MAG TPA: hypothetical protein VHN98_05175 [Acidimicrobiales bacterium]|nr:hypothetical protein [Acidimicrobiales bacterium]
MTESDPAFLVLHAVRLKGFADTEAIASITGLHHDDVHKHLGAALDEGLVTRRDGRISGWALTSAGRNRHYELVAVEVAESGARDRIDDAYHRFLAVNTELLGVCTDWQLRDGVLNDHGDAAYDDAVIARLRRVDEVVQPVCVDLGAALSRLRGYGGRLGAALERVERGDRDWFAKPMIDSYHTVWFELHEDLLVTLGIERAKEAQH